MRLKLSHMTDSARDTVSIKSVDLPNQSSLKLYRRGKKQRSPNAYHLGDCLYSSAV